MPELYIVHAKPNSILWNSDEFMKDSKRYAAVHRDFHKTIQRVLPGFDAPFLAFYKNGTFDLPCSDNGCYISTGGEIVKGTVNYGFGPDYRTSLPLAEFIDQCVTATIPNQEKMSHQNPITSIIEFSPMELYPDVMDELRAKYNIREVYVPHTIASKENFESLSAVENIRRVA